MQLTYRYSCLRSSAYRLAAHAPGWLCLLLVCLASIVRAQGYLLDRGERPANIYHEVGGQQRVVGRIEYQVFLPNGTPIDNTASDVSFGEEEVARLSIHLHVLFDRPNARRIKNLRVAFPPQLLNAVRGQTWVIDGERSRPGEIRLRHDDRVRLHYVYDRPGPVSFHLPFAVLPVGTNYSGKRTYSATQQRNRILSKQIVVRNLLTEEELFWRQKKERFAGVVDYLFAYPNGNHSIEANQFIRQTVDKDFESMVTGGKVATIHAFIDRYTPYARLELVEQLLASARQALKQQASANYQVVAPLPTPKQAVRNRFANTVASAAQEEAIRTGKPGYRVTDLKGGEVAIELFNFKQPVYYDVYGGLLDIDDNYLLSEKRFSVTQLGQQPVNLLIVERGREERYVSIPLDNSLSVDLTEDTLTRTVNIAIQGGVGPFSVYLQPLDGQPTDWGKAGIDSSHLSIPQYELHRAGLEGNYAVRISNNGGVAPYTLAEPLFVAPRPGNRNWVYPLFVALGLGLLALLLLFILQRSGNRHRRLARNQYHRQ